MQVKNLRPYEVEIPGAGTVEAGGTIEVDDDIGAGLVEQSDNWEQSKSRKTSEEK